jgi:hypothetical protein
MAGEWIDAIVAGIAFAAVFLGLRAVSWTRARLIARRRSVLDDLRSRGT